MISPSRTDSQLIVDFFDESDLFEMYDIYRHFRVNNYVVAHEMRKVIEDRVKECPDFRVWWKEVLAEESFADFSG